MVRFNRRMFGKLAAWSAAGSALPVEAAATKLTLASTSDRPFPAGFLWGSATASYQVEGAVHEDGRGTTIWDTFSHIPGKIHNNDTGDVADDSYHRYREDIALMQALGLKTCRFSIAWSRIFPHGTGAPNQKGIDHYRIFAEALLKAGIEPFCTLFHWDLPQALEDKGGWQNKDTSEAFAAYAGYTAGKLGDAIKHWMTLNEMSTFVELGYGTGVHAPGLKVGPQMLAQVRHHAVLAHGLGVQAIRANARGARVGAAENIEPIIPVYNAPEHIAAAKKAMVEENAGYSNVVHTGKYTDAYLERLGANAPRFTPQEMKAIGSPLDFQGLNIYTSTPVRAADNARGYERIPNPASYPRTASDWLTVGPEALYWCPKIAAEVWNIREIYITENGCSSADYIAHDGNIYDTDRVMYLNAYMTQMQRATSEGVPIKGYFLWSLLDNYEWADGYDKRFGITYVDFKTQKRTPKLSSKFYANVIAKNGL